MKRLIFSFVLLGLLTGFVSYRNDVYPHVKNESFTRGEVINFKMTYGIFTVGKGSVRIHPNYFKLNNRDCFKIDVYGQTVGMVDWVADVDDQWGAYIDTLAILPHQFYRRIREGRYKKDEWTFFDHERKKIVVKTIDNKTGRFKEFKYYDAPGQVRDMIAGFLYLRNMNMSKLKQGDTVLVSGFFEDEFYKMKIVYAGKQTIRVKAGK